MPDELATERFVGKLTRYGDFKKFITKWMQKWGISSDVGKGFGRLHGDVDPEYISEGLVVPILIVVLYILYVRILFVSWALRQRNSKRMKRFRPQIHQRRSKISLSEKNENNLTVNVDAWSLNLSRNLEASPSLQLCHFKFYSMDPWTHLANMDINALSNLILPTGHPYLME